MYSDMDEIVHICVYKRSLIHCKICTCIIHCVKQIFIEFFIRCLGVVGSGENMPTIVTLLTCIRL